jgi:hypothetical protein
MYSYSAKGHFPAPTSNSTHLQSTPELENFGLLLLFIDVSFDLIRT